ncbi:hypothetical protein CWS01_14345 [Niallia nealsonii]|uniref:Uncharacterized protein n=1 Tax=Niallia nealsonii TaxID=115979 RepID=A0A2N0Z024_9BACI|nr:hypothetical protein CWS01_14345 [Niallia nealsonii]
MNGFFSCETAASWQMFYSFSIREGFIINEDYYVIVCMVNLQSMSGEKGINIKMQGFIEEEKVMKEYRKQKHSK